MNKLWIGATLFGAMLLGATQVHAAKVTCDENATPIYSSSESTMTNYNILHNEAVKEIIADGTHAHPAAVIALKPWDESWSADYRSNLDKLDKVDDYLDANWLYCLPESTQWVHVKCGLEQGLDYSQTGLYFQHNTERIAEKAGYNNNFTSDGVLKDFNPVIGPHGGVLEVMQTWAGEHVSNGDTKINYYLIEVTIDKDYYASQGGSVIDIN